MFNFFNEIKKNLKNIDVSGKYNLINISGKIIYVEGHLGITFASKEIISFKVKDGRINVFGKEMILSELSEDTLKIEGEISNIEAI